MDFYGIVYLLIDGSNDEEYVGQTTKTFEERFNEHKCGKQYIDRVIRKRGVDMFATAILKVCYSREELDYWERRLIKSRNTMAPNGYNLTEGGEGGSPCEETKEKLREAAVKFYDEHPEARDRISEEQIRRFSDPAEREKAAERTRKSFEDPERAAKHSEGQKRRFERQEERDKVAATVTEHFSDPAEREAQSERIKAYFNTPSAREKCGEAQSKRFEDPAERKKVSDGLKKYFEENGTRKQSQDTRDKISVKRKAYWRRVRIAKLLPTITAENLSAANLPAEVSDGLKKFHAANPDAVTEAYELRKKSQVARTERQSKQAIAQKARRARERVAKMPLLVAQQNLSAAKLPAKIEFAKLLEKLLAKTAAKDLPAKTASTKHSEGQKQRFERQEERDKISAAVTERFSDPAEREVQSERIKAYFDTPGAREKCGEAQSKRFEDPAERKKVSDGLKKYFEENGTRKQSQETRDKISVKRKAYWRRVRIAKLLPTIAAENLSAANLPAEVSDGLKKFHAANPDAVTEAYELRKKSQVARTERQSKQAIAQKARRARERVAKMPLLVAQQNLSAAKLPAKIALS